MRYRAALGRSAAVLFGVAALATARPDTLAEYAHQTWRTENGLPQNSVYSIAQTSDGYIWLATEGGLARFDGFKFASFDSENTPELKSNKVRYLLTAKDGSLWIATAEGLTRLEDGKFTAFTTAQGLPSNNLRFLTLDRHGALVAVTSEGVAVYQSNQFTRAETPGFAGMISAAVVDHDGNFWLGGESGLSVLPGDKQQPVIGPELGATHVRALFVDRSDRLWIGTGDGLVIYENGRGKALDLGRSLAHLPVTALMQDRNGVIWAGTETGVVRIVDNKLNPITSPDSLSTDAIHAAFEDREGNIWIGTDSTGLTLLRDQRFRKFGHNEGMPDDLVRCVFQDSNGVVWAGTNGHGLRRFDGHTFSSFTTANGLSSDVILSVSTDAEGDLLVGTPDGLNIVHERQVRWLTSADGLPDDFIRSIYADTDGCIWLGTRRGLAHYAAGRVTTYTAADGLPSDLVGAMLHGKNGCLWIGTLKGLACFSNGRIDASRSPQKLKHAAITSLYEDQNGVLWIGTENGGLARLAGKGAFEYPEALGLPRSVSGVIEDANGQLWITSPRGLFRVLKSELNAYAVDKTGAVSVIAYGTADGLPVSEFSTGGHPTVWRDRQNTIWFASARGVVSMDARQTAKRGIAPPVVFERITADDRVVDSSQIPTFGPGLSRISFEYAGLSFAAPQQVRFKYRMEGFDKNWIDAGSRGAAYYTSLAPGKYRFTVIARNGDGLWNTQGASFSFHLRPHVYQTNWFRSLLLLALAALAYVIYRWRVKQVRTEFNAVIAERNRIAREIHDTLAQGFVGVSVQLELARRVLSTSIESASEILREAQTLVQESLAEARRSIWNLRADGTAEQDLRSKVAKTIRQFVRNEKLNVSVDVTGAYRPLPARVETEVLRILQEAVTNVVRHANATRLDVLLAFGARDAEISVSDDGNGFKIGDNAQGPEGHFGLRGIHERAAAIDGKVVINTAEGKGTRVCLKLPLK